MYYVSPRKFVPQNSHLLLTQQQLPRVLAPPTPGHLGNRHSRAEEPAPAPAPAANLNLPSTHVAARRQCPFSFNSQRPHSLHPLFLRRGPECGRQSPAVSQKLGCLLAAAPSSVLCTSTSIRRCGGKRVQLEGATEESLGSHGVVYNRPKPMCGGLHTRHDESPAHRCTFAYCLAHVSTQRGWGKLTRVTGAPTSDPCPTLLAILDFSVKDSCTPEAKTARKLAAAWDGIQLKSRGTRLIGFNGGDLAVTVVAATAAASAAAVSTATSSAITAVSSDTSDSTRNCKAGNWDTNDV